MEATIYWTTALMALVGVVLNIHKKRCCFAIWAVTNATWTVVDYLHGIHAQAALQFVFFLLSIYGLVRWSRLELDEGPRKRSKTGGLL